MKHDHTILFGNGLNLLSPGCPRWSDLLDGMDPSRPVNVNSEKIPYTFQYEIRLPNKYYTPVEFEAGLHERSYERMEQSERIVKEKICEMVGDLEPNRFYERLCRLDVSNYCTTNYEYQLQNAFEAIGDYDFEVENEETHYSIRRRTNVSLGGKHVCGIWNIHGEIDRPNTLMLGLDHYCESIGKINDYIKGRYISAGWQMRPSTDTLEKRLRSGRLSDTFSWIDLLFCSDVHIVGIGLDYSESDLWWLLSRRMRLFKKFEGEVPPNNVYFYGDLDKEPDKAHLLQKLGVEYVRVPVIDKDFNRQYDRILDLIEEKTGTRE